MRSLVNQISSIQSVLSVQFSQSPILGVTVHAVTPCTTACHVSLSFAVSWNLLKFMSIELIMSSNHLIPFSSCPQSFPVSGSFPVCWLFISVGQYWTFSFNISPSNEYSGLISFRIDWFDLLAFQGTLKSLLQHCSSKTSVLWRSAFFIVQLSHLYVTTGKAIALTIQDLCQ